MIMTTGVTQTQLWRHCTITVYNRINFSTGEQTDTVGCLNDYHNNSHYGLA
jgi:hypothetical protein